MDELGRIVQALGSLPGFIGAILGLYLCLRTPAGLIITKKLFNGHDKDGAPRANLAGEATVDFWRAEHRKNMEDVIEPRFDEMERHMSELRDDLRSLSAMHRELMIANSNGVNRIVDSIMQLVAAFKMRS